MMRLASSLFIASSAGIRDEIVEVETGVFLGKILHRDDGGDRTPTLGFFARQAPLTRSDEPECSRTCADGQSTTSCLPDGRRMATPSPGPGWPDWWTSAIARSSRRPAQASRGGEGAPASARSSPRSRCRCRRCWIRSPTPHARGRVPGGPGGQSARRDSGPPACPGRRLPLDRYSDVKVTGRTRGKRRNRRPARPRRAAPGLNPLHKVSGSRGDSRTWQAPAS